MKICVYGLWHLGSVTAACLANVPAFKVTGLDLDAKRIALLQKGKPPVFEPGLELLIQKGIRRKNLNFTADAKSAVSGADIVLISFDTPLNEKDEADIGWLKKQITGIFPFLKNGTLLVIQSQVPAGTTRSLETVFSKRFPNRNVSFAYVPENLRIGKSVSSFLEMERVALGTHSGEAERKLRLLFRPFTKQMIPMSVESAEMVKHALNSFLAVSVALTNEFANLSEALGADFKDVELALRSDSRIGPKAYVKAGSPFAGGTLARDLVFVNQLARKAGLTLPLLSQAIPSNQLQKKWIQEKLTRQFKRLNGKKIAIAGLASKPDSNVIRRSETIELAKWIKSKRGDVRVFDPLVRNVPAELKHLFRLESSLQSALKNADALVIFKDVPGLVPAVILRPQAEESKNVRSFAASLKRLRMTKKLPVIIDPNRILKLPFRQKTGHAYFTVGKSHE